MTVKLVTSKEECVKSSRRALVNAAKERPDSVVIVYRAGGKTWVSSTFTNRLEMIGALHAAIQETWDA